MSAPEHGRHQLRVALGAVDTAVAAMGVEGVAEPGVAPLVAPCTTCEALSTRRYCDECASELNVEPYENPPHQEYTT